MVLSLATKITMNMKAMVKVRVIGKMVRRIGMMRKILILLVVVRMKTVLKVLAHDVLSRLSSANTRCKAG